MEEEKQTVNIIDILYEQAKADEEVNARLSKLTPEQLKKLNKELKKENGDDKPNE